MIFSLLKNAGKKVFFALLAFLFVFSAQAQTHTDLAGSDSSETDIACKDLPSALEKYNADMSLNQMALTAALKETHIFLKKALEGNRLSHSDLSKMIEALKEAKVISQRNETLLLDKRSDIEYFLQECLKKIK